MKITADYHTHTKYSDGKSTIEENIKSAIKKNLRTVGITDHAYKHAGFGVKYEDYDRIREEIDILKEKYKDIEILMGTECNVLDDKGNIDLDEHILSLVDYVMAGYHYGSMIKNARGGINHLCNLIGPLKHTQLEYNTNALINAMKNNDIFILTHPGDKGYVDIEAIAEVAQKTDTILEINERHHNLTTGQLIKIRNYDIKYVISSDAHLAKNVGEVDEAMKRVVDSKLDVKRIINLQL